MPRSMVIEMAGTACTIICGEPLTEVIRQRYDGFFSSRRPAFTIEVELVSSYCGGDDGGAGQPGPALEIQPTSVTHRRRGGQLELIGSTFEAQIDFAAGRGTIWQPFNLTPLDLLLKVIYAELLLREPACFVHACAVEREGRGSLFFGPSGSGKSTLARSAGAAVLADELVIVRREEDPRGAYSVHGTPFWGGRNRQAPLADLFALRFDPANASFTSLSRVESLRRLLPCLGGFSTSGGDEAGLFDFGARLAQEVRCHELCLSPQSDPVGWLDVVAA